MRARKALAVVCVPTDDFIGVEIEVLLCRGPVSAQGFFLGAAVIGAGGHSIQM